MFVGFCLICFYRFNFFFFSKKLNLNYTYIIIATLPNTNTKMDLKQRKLTKAEWDSLEVPLPQHEIDILNLINNGFDNVNIRLNNTKTLFSYLKIDYSKSIEEYLYVKYFAPKINALVERYNITFITNEAKHKGSNSNAVASQITAENNCLIQVGNNVTLKSADKVRLGRLDMLGEATNTIYEFILYDIIENILENKEKNNNAWMHYYYTLNKLMKNNIDKLNTIVKHICEAVVINFEDEVDLLYVVENSSQIIEKNTNILKYADMALYQHQKDIFTCIKSPKPKLVLYIAPTGTGKTLTPIGISQHYKVIFVCAARHVGLALARAAISINKRIAFAFGASCPDDVRLHYFSAKEFTVNKRTGQIRKVDNTVGDKVEILICDIRSYLAAMNYMLAFNSQQEIITYWDEPTITLDYESHDLHATIKKNWTENIIPNMVLSSATLPKLHELTQTVADFQDKFPNSSVFNIVSHDCKKTIPIVNSDGYIVMPHNIDAVYSNVLNNVKQCEENLTLMRYFDLDEASKFIKYIETKKYNKGASKFNRNFASSNDIDMSSIKAYYLKMLKNISPEHWDSVYSHFQTTKTKSIQSNDTVDDKGNKTAPREQRPSSAGIYITTKDAHTLTDGATIYIAKNLQKIAMFCIQQANIPVTVMTDIMSKIEFNNQINERISNIELELELEEQRILYKLGTGTSDNSREARGLVGGKKDKKGKAKIANNIINKSENKKISQLRDDIATLKTMIKQATIDDLFIPNKLTHKNKWSEFSSSVNAFTSDISDEIILSIMLLKDVDDSWKILLLLGIGVFTEHKSIAYTEIMKTLADQQKLYLIIADSDYIYGTNYQFCHGYLGKDLDLTQEKIIQAIGRIGRNNIQQHYSARFRCDDHIKMLFTNITAEQKPEVRNMNMLFNSKNVVWNGFNYVETILTAITNKCDDDDSQDGDSHDDDAEDDER